VELVAVVDEADADLVVASGEDVALAIGHLAVGRVIIRKARIGALEVDELTVRLP